MTKAATPPIGDDVLTFDQARTAFAASVLRATRGERLRLTRNGRVRAAIISAADLQLLERLERRAELSLALQTIGKRNRSYRQPRSSARSRPGDVASVDPRARYANAASGTTCGGGRNHSASITAAANAHRHGTRNSERKSVTPSAVYTVWISHGQIEFASSAPPPRIIRLNSPCALLRMSFGR